VSAALVCQKSSKLFVTAALAAWWIRSVGILAALMLVCFQVQSAPLIVLDKQPKSLDLRGLWEHTMVSESAQPTVPVFDPQDVWQWPAQKFAPKQPVQPVSVAAHQRCIARFELASPTIGSDFYLVFKMPRLDAVHVSYRYGNEPWKRESAGDTVPMTKWPFFERQPTFAIPQREGNLSVVVELSHVGVVDAEVLLENSNAFRQEGVNSAMTSGLLIGVNLVMAAVGALAAVNFRRLSFLAISLMTLLMAVVVFANSGLAGMHVLTGSAEFNDQSKFVANTLLCLAYPWVTAVVLSQRFYARGWWYAALTWTVSGFLFMLWAMQYELRGWTQVFVPGWLVMSLLMVVGMLAQALLRGQPSAVAASPGIGLYAISLIVPFLAYRGYIQYNVAGLITAVATLMASLIFLQVMVKKHRYGRMVIARAQSSDSRDALTGLLNRSGFEQMLAKTISRVRAEKLYAAFFYVTVSDAKTLQERFGDEGFEGGMVQMAAAISSSISVVDTVGRVTPNAFAVTVLMPKNVQLANSMAQKMLTRTMSLASHGAPMAQTARIAIAWLPVFGTQLPEIERRALRTLRKIEEGKRIAWVGGDYAQMDLLQMPDGTGDPTTKPNNGQTAEDDLPSLPGMINRLEREMLGPDTEQLKTEADRLMRMMQAQAEQPDFANTKVEAREPVSRR
jgi:diguanylate cyclase (GGDEF)-like protein